VNCGIWNLFNTCFSSAYCRARRARSATAKGKEPSARQVQDLVGDGDAGADVLVQIFGGPRTRAGGSYWDWDAGLALLFWRWHPEVQHDARGALPIWVQGKLPQYQVPQRVPTRREEASHLGKKLQKM
jgi:hypothetical protein